MKIENVILAGLAGFLVYQMVKPKPLTRLPASSNSVYVNGKLVELSSIFPEIVKSRNDMVYVNGVLTPINEIFK